MKSIVKSIYLVCFILIGQTQAQDSFIHVDQFGYYKDASKIAIISNPLEGFNAHLTFEPSSTIELRDLISDEVVFTGSPISWKTGNKDDLSGDQGWHFDFTDFTDIGRYYIFDVANDAKSPPFTIDGNPYIKVLKAAFKMYYYNRCGPEKIAPYADMRWTDGESFSQDKKARYIYNPENESLEKDLSGGWFDAGDFNKYVTFNYAVIHNLLTAYENASVVFGDDWNIPESGNNLPDILDEVKWELDWMKKMVNSDGSVHIKMGSKNHDENSTSPPSANSDPRYYGPTCTSSAATLASNFAHAALVFTKQYNYENYAQELVGIAGGAFDYVLPSMENGTLETDCDDGSIVAGDADLSADLQWEAMVSAAIYLFEFTGFDKYHDFIMKYVPQLEPITSAWWGPYKLPLQDALLRYADMPFADQGLSEIIRTQAETAVANNWDAFFGMNDETLYRDYIPEWSYHWGSNNSKAGFGNLNLLMDHYEIGMETELLQGKAEGVLHSFHGVNPLGIVYLSNMYEYGATKSVNEMYHIWFGDGTDFDNAITSPKGPAPGYVVGGPNKDFSLGNISPPANQPPTKSYLDYNTGWPENSWEISEPAIYYQANYIRLLSQIIERRGLGTVHTKDESISRSRILISPNPASEYFQLYIKDYNLSLGINLTVFDIIGRNAKSQRISNNGERIKTNDLTPGTYILSITGDGIHETHKLVIE